MQPCIFVPAGVTPNIAQKSGTVDRHRVTQWIFQCLMHNLHPHVSLRLVQLLAPVCNDCIRTAHQHDLPVRFLSSPGNRCKQAGTRNVVRHCTTELAYSRKKKRLGSFYNRRTLFDGHRLQPLKARQQPRRGLRYVLTHGAERRDLVTCSALVGRPRFGGPGATKGEMSEAEVTCSASHCSTSSTRHRSRFVPGNRQMGGRDCGLRVASLRMLATDFCRYSESCSTVSKACMD